MSVLDIEVAPRAATPVNKLAGLPALPATVRILFGSEMGNAELVADNFSDALGANSVNAECLELNDQPVAELRDLGIAMFVISTCGEGDMPYNSEKFWLQLTAKDAPSLEGLHYAVFAMGDSGYTYYCDAGVKLDARLAELGATRIADRTDCDVSYVDPSNQWIAERVAQLSPSKDLDAEDLAATIAASTAATGPRWTRDTPFVAKLRSNLLLSHNGSSKEVRHFEIDISGGDFTYSAGDSLGILPTNCAHAVDRFLAVTKLSGDEQIDGRSVRALATNSWELRFPSAALLDAISTMAPDSPLAAALHQNGHDAGEAWMATNGVIETLAQFTTPPSLTQLAKLLGPIRHRAYSIASTPVTNADSVHLTVATQRNSPVAELRSGVGTGFLADDLQPGDTIRIFPLPNHNFRLPTVPSTPIIMVGPGVGAAPFLGFLQERAATPDNGKAWLFFGDQHEATDFIYAEQWRLFQSSGALTRLDTAFSRDTDEKVYVQDRIRENGAELVRWLTEGAHFYVCGDGKRMAADVDRALTEVACEHLGEARGHALVESLHAEKRYLRDVY